MFLWFLRLLYDVTIFGMRISVSRQIQDRMRLAISLLPLHVFKTGRYSSTFLCNHNVRRWVRQSKRERLFSYAGRRF